MSIVLLLSCISPVFAQSDILPEGTVGVEIEQSAPSSSEAHVGNDIDMNNTTEIQRPVRNPRLRASTIDYEEYIFTDTLTTALPYDMYGIVPVYSGEVIQAKLVGPENVNLDYFVSLYECTSTGTLTSFIDYCDYTPYNVFIPEQVGYRNITSGIKYFVVVVDSNLNFSDTESYEINITVGYDTSIANDIYEPDESAYTANDLGDVSGNGVTLTRNINAPIDNEWYYVNIPTGAGYDTLEVVNLPNGLIVESFVALSGSEVAKLGEATAASNELPIWEGTNYIRISFNSGARFNIDARDYEIIIRQPYTPPPEPAYYVVYTIVDGHCLRLSDDFTDRVWRPVVLENRNVKFRVEFYDENDQPFAATKTITASFNNPYWSAPLNQREASVTVNNATYAEVNLTSHLRNHPTETCDFITATVKVNGVALPQYNAREMVLIRKYNNGELGGRCEHWPNQCIYY